MMQAEGEGGTFYLQKIRLIHRVTEYVRKCVNFVLLKITVDYGKYWLYNIPAGGERRGGVDKVSVLISGEDSEYNESLAAALSEQEKNFFVTCVSPERLKTEADRLAQKFDIFLVESESTLPQDVVGPKIMLLGNEESNFSVNEAGHRVIFKYRGVKALATAIYREFKGRSYAEEVREENEGDYRFSSTGFRNITVVGDSDEDQSTGAAVLISKGLALMGKKVLFFDLQEYRPDFCLTEKRIGERSWDDFIYCCIYGKTDDMVRSPASYSSADESEVCYFTCRKGKNPFRSLEEDEIHLFYEGLREKCCMDFGIGVLSEVERWRSMSCLAESDLVIILSDGGEKDRERCERIKRILAEREDFGGKIITLSLGPRWDMGEYCDFSVEYNEDAGRLDLKSLMETRTWKDITRIAGFIGDRCFE